MWSVWFATQPQTSSAASLRDLINRSYWVAPEALQIARTRGFTGPTCECLSDALEAEQREARIEREAKVGGAGCRGNINALICSDRFGAC